MSRRARGWDHRAMSTPSLTPLAAAVLHLPKPPERVLEICCGDGDGVLFLAREFPSARVRGVDPSEASIRAAVARVGLDPEGRVAFKQGSCRRSLAYPDGLFDLVVQRRGTVHARETARMLRPGGHFIQVEGPASGPLSRGRLAWLRRRLRMLGFETVRRDEAGGACFWVMRLGGD
jgi:ubiquinone/menaquinone biosynthesis C-methylase UbiE